MWPHHEGLVVESNIWLMVHSIGKEAGLGSTPQERGLCKSMRGQVRLYDAWIQR